VFPEPTELHLTKAGGAVFDVRALDGPVVRQERPERPAPGEVEEEHASTYSLYHVVGTRLFPSACSPFCRSRRESMTMQRARQDRERRLPFTSSPTPVLVRIVRVGGFFLADRRGAAVRINKSMLSRSVG